MENKKKIVSIFFVVVVLIATVKVGLYYWTQFKLDESSIKLTSEKLQSMKNNRNDSEKKETMENQNKEVDNLKDKNALPEEIKMPEEFDIKISDPEKIINIPASATKGKFTRGTYVYELKRKSVLNDAKYVVYYVDPGYFLPQHKPAPEDAYATQVEIFYANDEGAVRAMKSFDGPSSVEIKTDEDMQEAQQLVADSNRLNSIKFRIAPLASSQDIKKTIKQLKIGQTINVSGYRFEHTKVINKGKEEPISLCLSANVLYLTKLEIIKQKL